MEEKKKFNWNVPMTRKDWGVVYIAVFVIYMVVYIWIFCGDAIKNLIKILFGKDKKNPVEELKNEKWSFDNEDN